MSYTVKAIEPDTTEHVFTIEEDEYILDMIVARSTTDDDVPRAIEISSVELPDTAMGRF